MAGNWKTGLEARIGTQSGTYTLPSGQAVPVNAIEQQVIDMLEGRIVPTAEAIREAKAQYPTHRSSRRYAERHGYSVDAVRDVLGLVPIAEGRALICRSWLACHNDALPVWAK